MRAFVVVLTHLVAVLMLAGWALSPAASHNSPAPEPVGGLTADPGAPGPVEAAEPGGSEAPLPVGVQVPSVDIDTGMVPLGLETDGSLEVPEDPHISGWWTAGATPGAPGAAVIVGHVDSREGPGAFFRLGDVEPGDRVTVDREGGASVDFRVQRVEVHPKEAFPTAAVYEPTEAPTLRLITCSGAFDRQERSYEDNTIVFLELAEPVAPEVADHGLPQHSALAGGPSEPEPQVSRGVPFAAAVLSLVGATGGLWRHQHVVRSRRRPRAMPARSVWRTSHGDQSIPRFAPN